MNETPQPPSAESNPSAESPSPSPSPPLLPPLPTSTIPSRYVPVDSGGTQEQGCLATGLRIFAVLVIGLFVIGGLIFATCLLSFRR